VTVDNAAGSLHLRADAPPRAAQGTLYELDQDDENGDELHGPVRFLKPVSGCLIVNLIRCC
jgi:hypothetical protein